MRRVHLQIAKEYANKRIKEHKSQLTTQDYKDIAIKVFGSDVKPLSFIQCRKSMNMPEVKKLAELRILELLDRNDIKPDKPFELLKEAEKIAKSKENSSDLIKIADRYIQLQDLMPSKTVITEQRTYKSDLENNYNEAKRTVTVTTDQTVTPNNEAATSNNEASNE